MDKEHALAALDARVFAARTTMATLCEVAGVAQSTVSRWRKKPSSISVRTLTRLESALEQVEAKDEA